MTYKPRGLYFEEFAIGQKIVTAGRTITEADIVSFATLTGDFNAIHVDAEYAAGQIFKQRIAHGLLGMSYALGLTVQTGMMEGTVVAFREIGTWKFSKPIFIGDTIHVEIEVQALKPMPRVGGGLVTTQSQIVNQRGEVTQTGTWALIMMLSPK
jgi:acyl dehydratase